MALAVVSTTPIWLRRLLPRYQTGRTARRVASCQKFCLAAAIIPAASITSALRARQQEAAASCSGRVSCSGRAASCAEYNALGSPCAQNRCSLRETPKRRCFRSRPAKSEKPSGLHLRLPWCWAGCWAGCWRPKPWHRVRNRAWPATERKFTPGNLPAVRTTPSAAPPATPTSGATAPPPESRRRIVSPATAKWWPPTSKASTGRRVPGAFQKRPAERWFARGSNRLRTGQARGSEDGAAQARESAARGSARRKQWR